MEVEPELYEHLLNDESQCKRIESKILDEKHRHLFSHLIVLALVASNYVMKDTELYLLYFLLKQVIGCDFVHTYSLIMMITFITNLFWRPISGWLTDATEKWAHWLLWASNFAVLACQALMVVTPFFFSGQMAWIFLAVLQTLRNLGQVQMYNSIWKIFKLRLENKYGLIVGSQCSVLSKIGVTGQLVELCILACIFIWLWLSSKYHWLSFQMLETCFYGVCFFFNFLCIALSLAISRDYFSETTPQSEETEGLLTINNFESFSSFHDQLNETKNLSKGEEDFIKSFQNPLQEAEINPWEYVVKGFSHLYQTKAALHGLLHITFLYAVYASLANAETLSIPLAGKQDENEECGGYFENSFFQSAAINIAFITGALFYLGILKQTKSTLFFKFLYPLAGLLLIGVSLVLIIPDISRLFKSISLATLEGFLWFFILYDNFLAVASLSSAYFGLYSTLFGLVQTAGNLLFSTLYTYHMPNLLFVLVIFVFLGLSVVHAAGFGFFYSTALKKASFHFC